MSDLTKQMILEAYVKFIHLNEQRTETDLSLFFKQATEDQLPLLPKNMTSIHAIDCIGENEPINNTSIAQKMNLSKANITKITSKLLREGLIQRFQLTNNKKEVYFRLSTTGKQIFAIHQKIHKQKEEQFDQFLDAFSTTEQATILKFLRELTNHVAKK